MALMNMVSSLNLAMDDAMREDDTVVLLGQDIGVDEGVFRVTANLLERYGDRRGDLRQNVFFDLRDQLVIQEPTIDQVLPITRNGLELLPLLHL